MLESNAVLFVSLQFGSRFANSFLVTAARYELLEAGGIAEFAWAQVTTNVARMVVSQVAGLLTDNFALRHMYVATEACNLLLALAMLFGHSHPSLLFFLNVGLGLIFSFSQPVTKSMPPAVVAAHRHEDLAIVNGWDLTCDKVGRYLAPIAYAVISSTHGFGFAVRLSCGLYALLTVLRACVKVSEPPPKEKVEGAIRPTVGKKLWGLLQQVWDGVMSLRRDRVLRLLILNTLVTNVFLYPLNSVHFPVLFKQMAEASSSVEIDQTVVGSLLAGAMSLMRIKKKKAWMNYTALVSLGGVVGPFLSNLMIYMLESYSASQKKDRLKVGVMFGVAGQIVTSAILALIVSVSWSLGTGMLVLLLVLAWVLTIAVNNIVTTYFNSISQEKLQRGERGRFIANIMTMFTLGSSLGTLLYSRVISGDGDGRDVSGSVNLLLCGLMIKVLILAMLYGDGSFGAGDIAEGKAKTN
mmetsp:Transcript_8618/g.13663  ORF Transcript_8618/g.13663 Transcript_8618/m.13663 type:complete len:467 (-) Transcript_8618:103-1503(-)